MKKVKMRIFSDFNNLNTTMQALRGTKFTNFKQSYHIKRLMEDLAKEHNHFMDMYNDIMKEREFSEPEEGQKREVTNKEYIDKKLEDLLEVEFDCKWAPLPSTIVETFNPTPAQFTLLEHLMDERTLEDYIAEEFK